ncbi:hypothetical protein B0H10DRAFT_1954866 [Mycena sp. CBHHK59/15]|nr:hypothetical protein B0H10DRAFT_1954866 [Mycena sp. CBHHK59/15]
MFAVVSCCVNASYALNKGFRVIGGRSYKTLTDCINPPTSSQTVHRWTSAERRKHSLPDASSTLAGHFLSQARRRSDGTGRRGNTKARIYAPVLTSTAGTTRVDVLAVGTLGQCCGFRQAEGGGNSRRHKTHSQAVQSFRPRQERGHTSGYPELTW